MKTVAQLPLEHDELLYVLEVLQTFALGLGREHDAAERMMIKAAKRYDGLGVERVDAIHLTIARLHDAICPIPLQKLDL